MPRSRGESLTEREAQIMDVLWRHEAATADEIRSRLPGAPHDSTVRTLLRVMEEKGLVTHDVQQRTFVYRSRVVQSKAQRKAVRGLLDRLFGGSVKNLVLQLLDDEDITPEELQRLAREAKPDSGSSQKRGKS
jgi:BlaI family transcriptional regulator, penicillinase repressor